MRLSWLYSLVYRDCELVDCIGRFHSNPHLCQGAENISLHYTFVSISAGSTLVTKAIEAMIRSDCDEVSGNCCRISM